MLIRLPASGLEVVGSPESRAITNMSLDSDADRQQLDLLCDRLDAASRVLVIIHSEGPSHYTLLERARVAVGQYELQYWDSLPVPSANGIKEAQAFADMCRWNAVVPPVCNGRKQPDGWSCGLYSLHFLEEQVRQHRGEPLFRSPVALSQLIARTNRFILAVKPCLPVVGSSVSTGASSSAGAVDAIVVADKLKEVEGSAKAQAAKASATEPVPSGPPPLPPPLMAPVVGSGFGADPSEPEFTWEQAVTARDSHSKCRGSGCAQCMRGWFVPRTLLHQLSKESARSVD